jgi:hypothetical protein
MSAILGILADIRALIILIITLVVAIIVIMATAPAWNAVSNVAPQPASGAISTYSTYLDATEVAGIVMTIIGTAAGVLGIAIRDARTLGVAVVVIVFGFFLVTGL